MIRKKYHGLFFILISLSCKVYALESQVPPIINPDNTIEIVLPFNDDELTKKVSMIQYDESLYNLAFNTYLQSRNIKNAYALASIAVKQQPTSIPWRQRLAEMALWNQEPMVALDQYLYLALNFNDGQAAIDGIKIAIAVHEDPALVQLLMHNIRHGDNSESTWQEYIDAMLRMGKPQELIKVLNTYQQKLRLKFYLNNLSEIYALIDDPAGQLAALQRLQASLGLKTEIAQQLAALYLNKGELNQAYQILNQASRIALPTDDSFWSMYANVSSLVGRSSMELHAYQREVKTQVVTPVSVYERLVELNKNSQPQQAYAYGSRAIRLYPNNNLLVSNTLGLLAEQEGCLDFPKIMAKLPKSMQEKLKYDINYWNARVSYWKQVGNNQEVIQSFLTAMNYLPRSDEIKAGYLSYLITTNNLPQLRLVLLSWQDKILKRPLLWSVAAQGYVRTDNPYMSKLLMSFFYKQFPEYKDNPYWLMLFKDSLENADLPKRSREVNRYAWPVYLKLLKKQTQPADYYQMIDYMKLAMTEAAGDPSAIALAKLQLHPTKDVELLMITWALTNDNTKLASAIYWYYAARGIKPPLWATLRIALNRNDRSLMKKLLLSKKEVVSYRDKIQAATEIDAISLAQSIAYKALKRNRKDSDLYDNYYTPVMLRSADNLYLSQEYYRYGNVAGPRTMASYTYYYSPGLSFSPYNSTWFTRNLSSSATSSNINNITFASVPAHDEATGVIIDSLQRRGNLTLNLGYRHNLDGFMTAKLTRNYQVHNDLEFTAALGYNQPADDTPALLIAGAEDNAELGFGYQIFNKDRISGELTNNYFTTQYGEYLAKGVHGMIRYGHIFNIKYPQWFVSPYGSFTNYYDRRRQLLTGRVLNLIPPTVTPNVNFLLPPTFTEYGLILGTGESYEDYTNGAPYVEYVTGNSYSEEYTHRWRPFGLFIVSRNSIAGLGLLYNFGIAGSVFGRDHLLLFYEKATNQAPGADVQQVIKASYRIYL